jgi:ATP-binding cassette subfamily B protein
MSTPNQGFLSFLGSFFGGPTGTSPRQRIRRLLNVADNAWWTIRTAWSSNPILISCMAALTLSEGLFPAGMALIMRGLINSVVDATSRQSGDLAPILPWLVLGLSLTVGMAVWKLLIQFLAGRLVDEVDIDLTTKILEHASRLDVAFYEDPRNQDIIHRARQNSAQHFSRFIVTSLRLLSNLVQIVSLLAILVAVEPLIILVLLPLALPHLLFQWYTSMSYYRTEYRRASKRRWSGYFSSLLTGRESVPEIKLLGLAPILLNRLRAIMVEFRDENRKRYLQRLTGSSISAVLTTLAVYGLFAHVIYKVLNAGLTVGDVAVFAAAALRLRGSLESSITSSASTFEQTLYISNLREFLNIQPRPQTVAVHPVSPLRGRIGFRDVSFTYPGASVPTLSNVNFTIEPGETVALVGKNGAGKTTLVKLLARFYDPSGGQILLDGTDARQWPLKYLHENITFVFQKYNRYEATVRENVAYGNWERLLHDRDETERVATEAGASKLVEGLPQGYDTLLGRKFGKHDLSGGQWQQLAVARALARDVQLVILDEPTSNLDAQAEYELFTRFCRIARGKTTILISHRFSTVSMADRILVLDAGRVVESGTHANLIAKKGHYATLYEYQRLQMGRTLEDEKQEINH